MHTKPTFLIGAGGHAKVVYDAMQAIGLCSIETWDDDASLSDTLFMDSMVKAPLKIECLGLKGHVAIGHAKARQRLSDSLIQADKLLLTVVHPLASVSSFAKLGIGSFIAAHATLGPCSLIAKGVIVNHGAVVDHDCQVGSFSHIAPNATLGGGVMIGKGCLIGSGAVILPGVHVANGVTVGGGAVVISDIKNEGAIVCGVPAK